MPWDDSFTAESSEESTEESSDALQAGDVKIAFALRLVASLREQLESLERVLNGSESVDIEELILKQERAGKEFYTPMNQSRTIDGVFDGEQMIGEDGRQYLVPPNYASKSKLVEGDLLRLIITDSGRFIFKQKGPIERQRSVGMLVRDEESDAWCVVADGRKFCVLPAAISFHKGGMGDDVVILLPKNAPSKWAAVENVIKRDAGSFS